MGLRKHKKEPELEPLSRFQELEMREYFTIKRGHEEIFEGMKVFEVMEMYRSTLIVLEVT